MSPRDLKVMTAGDLAAYLARCEYQIASNSAELPLVRAKLEVLSSGAWLSSFSTYSGVVLLFAGLVLVPTSGLIAGGLAIAGSLGSATSLYDLFEKQIEANLLKAQAERIEHSSNFCANELERIVAVLNGQL